jgi:Helix-turn-helix domain of resolvase
LQLNTSTALERVVRRLRRRWLGRFDEAATALARWFTRAAWQRSDAELRQILRRAGISVEFKVSREIRDALAAIVNENVSLIRSIPEQYLSQVEGSVMRSVLAGRDLAGLAAARRAGRTGGRPPKLTDDDIEAAKAMLANPDIGVTQIAHRLGVSPATLYRYIPAARTANTPGV